MTRYYVKNILTFNEQYDVCGFRENTVIYTCLPIMPRIRKYDNYPFQKDNAGHGQYLYEFMYKIGEFKQIPVHIQHIKLSQLYQYQSARWEYGNSKYPPDSCAELMSHKRTQ